MSAPALAEAITECRRALAAIDAAWNSTADNPDYSARHKVRRDAEADVVASLRMAGWHVVGRWDGYKVKAAGMLATSTSGLAVALNNWLRRAVEREARV